MKTVEKIIPGDNIWSDKRGWGTSPLAAMKKIAGDTEDMHVVSIKPGMVRGNHYHTESTEWILIFGGKADLAGY